MLLTKLRKQFLFEIYSWGIELYYWTDWSRPYNRFNTNTKRYNQEMAEDAEAFLYLLVLVL